MILPPRMPTELKIIFEMRKQQMIKKNDVVKINEPSCETVGLRFGIGELAVETGYIEERGYHAVKISVLETPGLTGQDILGDPAMSPLALLIFPSAEQARKVAMTLCGQPSDAEKQVGILIKTIEHLQARIAELEAL